MSKTTLLIKRVELDIHNMDRAQAKHYLERYITNADNDIKEICVIHGYSQGSVLKQLVQKGLKHHRIQSKILTLNQGETILVLK